MRTGHHELEIAIVRVIGRGTIKGVTLSESENGADVSGAVMRTEQAYFGGWVGTPILDRDGLRPGNEVRGPDAKYGDVIGVEDALGYLQGLRQTADR